MKDITRSRLLLFTLVIEGSVFILALIMGSVFGIKLFPLSENLLNDIAIGTFSSIPPLILFVFSMSRRCDNVRVLKSLKDTLLFNVMPFFKNSKSVDLILIAALAGLCEEVFFRGILQVKYGIYLASIVFGLLHFITPIYFIFATIMGFYIGYIYLYYDSLLIPVQLHYIYDAVALIYLKYFIINVSPSE
ncbi:abortive infection protein [Candidatus Magnetoovum chiemensis]|nr:abortive infection protein [Candidatus Magnetoovum chiemensis]